MDDLPEWYTLIKDRLEGRDKVEINRFELLIKTNQTLHDKIYGLSTRNTHLESKVLELDEACTRLQKLTDLGDPEEIKDLKTQVEKLQTEVSGLYKSNSSNAQSLLQARDEIAVLQEKTGGLKAEKQRLVDLLKQSNVKVKDFEELIQEKNNVIQILKDELAAHQLELVSREADLEALRKDNKMLVERWMRKMQEEADRMNSMNQFELVRFRSISVGSLPGSSFSESSSHSQRKLSAPALCEYESISNLQRTIAIKDTELTCIDCSRDGSMLAVGGSDKYMRLYDVENGLPDKTIVGPLSGTLCVSFSSNGDLLAGAGYENAVTVASTATCRSVHTLTGHTSKVFAAKFTLSDKLYSGSHDRTVKLWDLHRGYCVRTMFAMSCCNDVAALDSDGLLLASAHLDKALRFWDTRSGNCIKEVANLHAEQLTCVAASPDGNRVLTCSRDNTIKVIDARTFGVEVTLANEHLKVSRNWARSAWSPDGILVATGSQTGDLLRWNVNQSTALEPALHPTSSALLSCVWSVFEKGRLLAIDTSSNIYIYSA